MPGVAGLVLAAGAGRRMGGPKALVRGPDGEAWVARAARTLAEGGCDPVLVVLGAAAEQARALLPAGSRALVATDWAQGMGASLRAGLAELAGLPQDVVAVVVGLVDTPDVGPPVVARLLARSLPELGPELLARACYHDVPGHPVLLGRAHWASVAQAAAGDVGARGYLAGRPDVLRVECADLADGTDVDRPRPHPHGAGSAG